MYVVGLIVSPFHTFPYAWKSMEMIIYLYCIFILLCVYKPDGLIVGHMYTIATHEAMYKIPL